ncbi:unnamed protein product [Rhizopus stolonifer]
MDNDKENINASQNWVQNLAKEYFFIQAECSGNEELDSIKKRLIKAQKSNQSSSVAENKEIIENDKVFVADECRFVGSIMKTKAVNLRQNYHQLDANEKAIVMLGLNSIIDLSFKYPAAQSPLFNNKQWYQLQKKYKPKKYNTGVYSDIKTLLQPIFASYSQSKSFDQNWKNIYIKAKELAAQHDSELDTDKNDVSFSIYFILQILTIIKHQPSLFSDTVDSSEWDYIVKFWGVITERLFFCTGLRLKWGDTHLTVKDMSLKVDLRILHDSIKQRYNVENEVGVAEAAEEGPGDSKFKSDRCKVLIESKAVVDRYLLDGCFVDNVDSLQICGLEIFFINLTLQDQGLYVGTQFYHSVVNNSLNSLEKYMELAFNLLCFRDNCVEINNKYENHTISLRTQKKSAKRPASQIVDDDLSTKQSWIRGSWNPPRTIKTPPPSEPSNLFFKNP